MILLLITTLIKILTIFIPLLITIAYLTLFERKIIASIQNRTGPSIVGVWGLLQPLADGLKLFLKEIILPNGDKIKKPWLLIGRDLKGLFWLSPILTFFFSIILWAVIPLNGISISNINFDLLFILGISSVSIYGIILAGWASNSKYALLGALRSTAQMISYEVYIGLLFIIVIMYSGTFNLIQIVYLQSSIIYIIPLCPIWLIFFISILAETNRSPFDLPEAEAELVAGYNVEYSGMGFGLFFLGEYSNMIFMSVLTSILFLGGWNPLISSLDIIPNVFWLSLKTLFFLYLFILVRAALPRYRYDQLMVLGWKVFLPLSLGFVLLYSLILFVFNIMYLS